MRLRENTGSPAGHSGEKSWAEVSGRVNSVAGVEAHRQADDQDHKSDSEGLQSLWDGVVIWIHDSQDADNEGSCADDLREVEAHVERSLKKRTQVAC